MSGRVEAVAIAPKKRGAMTAIAEADVTVESGIAGDARGRNPGRQISLLFSASWERACDDLGRALPWTTRRANVLVGDMAVPSTVGTRLKIGTVLLEVTEETAPCQLMERAAPGLRKALAPDWRGGVCCKVLEGGRFAPGDAVTIAP
jgi:MOSC domain-containing protein YiiM